MKKLILALALVLMAASAAAQVVGVISGQALGVNPYGTGTGQGYSGQVSTPLFVSYAQVRVCTQAAIGTISTACTPLASITDIYGNSLSVASGNFGQTTTDVVGRYAFGCSAGVYWIQVQQSTSNTPQANYLASCPAANSSGITFETNGNANGSQVLLNLIAGTNISLANSGGNVTIADTITLPVFQTNSTNNASQTGLNLIAGANTTLTNSGNSVTIASAGGYNPPQGTTNPAYVGNWEGTPYTLSPGSSGYFSTSTGNQVQCIMFRLQYAISFNTLSFYLVTSGSGGSLIGIGVYSTAGSRLIHWDSISGVGSGGVTTATPTGGATTEQPNYYYWCWADSTAGSYGSQSLGALANATSNENSAPWNRSVVRGGYASNSMSSGVLPSTLGTLTAGFPNSNEPLPAWIVEP